MADTRLVGFLVVSLLDKTHLHSAFSGDAWGSEGPAAWRARVILFIGVALMAGGLAGSLVRPTPCTIHPHPLNDRLPASHSRLGVEANAV